MYANRRPKIPSGKTTEDLMNQHAKEARKKLEENRRMKHRKIADDASAVSSIHSNVRALRVRMPTKPKRRVITAPPQPSTDDIGDFAPPMELPLTSIVISEPPRRPKRKAATKATAALQPFKRKRSSPSIKESDESLASVQTCPPTTSSSTAPSRSKRRQLIKQIQIQNKSIVTSIKKAATQSQHVETDFTVGP